MHVNDLKYRFIEDIFFRCLFVHFVINKLPFVCSIIWSIFSFRKCRFVCIHRFLASSFLDSSQTIIIFLSYHISLFIIIFLKNISLLWHKCCIVNYQTNFQFDVGTDHICFKDFIIIRQLNRNWFLQLSAG